MTPTQKASLLLKAGLRVREINGQKVFVPKDESEESVQLLLKFWQDELLTGKLYEDKSAAYQFVDATTYLAEKIGGDAGKNLLAFIPPSLANPGPIQFRVPIMNVPTLLAPEPAPQAPVAEAKPQVPAEKSVEKPVVPEKKSYIIPTTPERPKIDRAREQAILEAAGAVIPGTTAPIELKTMPDTSGIEAAEYQKEMERTACEAQVSKAILDITAGDIIDVSKEWREDILSKCSPQTIANFEKFINQQRQAIVKATIQNPKREIPEHWNANEVPTMKLSLDLSGKEIDIRTLMDVFASMGIVIERFNIKV